MARTMRRLVLDAYERTLELAVSDPPEHVAVIQDGNRRFARKQGQDIHHGHRAGATTTERLLEWCQDLGIEELTLYAFSTENFNRSPAEREQLFDLLTEKLYDFADRPELHDHEVRIKAIGELDRLPPRVREAIDYAERKTVGYLNFRLNVAVAYGGRAELMAATQEIAEKVQAGTLEPEAIDVSLVEDHLYDAAVDDVDLIIRTGGDERTSNFLPWHANGNEAAVYFCTPYWPEFSKRDFLRAIRTYEYREKDWRKTRVERAIALLRTFGDHDCELDRAKAVVRNARSEGARPPDGEGDTELAD